MISEKVNFVMPKRAVTKVFIHCSASDNPAHDNVETIRKWHLERGFSDIGYHYYIDRIGQRFIGRSNELLPSAQKGHNVGSIAICCGGLEHFGAIQLTSLKELCRQINEAYKGDITFHGHCEVDRNKTCPVFNYKKVLVLDSHGRMR